MRKAGSRLLTSWKCSPRLEPWGRGTPVFFTALTRIRAFGIVFMRRRLWERERKEVGCGPNATDSHCSFRDLVDFREWMFLHFLYALMAISRFIKLLFQYFVPFKSFFVGKRVCCATHSSILNGSQNSVKFESQDHKYSSKKFLKEHVDELAWNKDLWQVVNQGFL